MRKARDSRWSKDHNKPKTHPTEVEKLPPWRGNLEAFSWAYALT